MNHLKTTNFVAGSLFVFCSIVTLLWSFPSANHYRAVQSELTQRISPNLKNVFQLQNLVQSYFEASRSYPYNDKSRSALQLALKKKIEQVGSAAFKDEASQKFLATVSETTERLFRAQAYEELDRVYRSFKREALIHVQFLESQQEQLEAEIDRFWKETYSILAVPVFICFLMLLLIAFSKKRFSDQTSFVLAQLRLIRSFRTIPSIRSAAQSEEDLELLVRELNRILELMKLKEQDFKDRENRVLQSGKLSVLGQLSAQIVHEIRNPLNAISLNIEWLESELTNPRPEIQQTLQSVLKEIRRLNEISEQYLVQAKVEMPTDKKTAVNDLISEIVQFAKEEDKSRNIEVKLELSTEEIFVKTDRARLKQALLNVLKNAKEAMPNGGTLSISTQVTGNSYCIKISDTGYGMNDVIKRKAFQPFFTTKTNGTGIGLLLTKEIVEEASGDLFFESQVGQGTTCTFQFPI